MEAESLIQPARVRVVPVDPELQRYAGTRGLGLQFADDRRTDPLVLGVGVELDPVELEGLRRTADPQSTERAAVELDHVQVGRWVRDRLTRPAGVLGAPR